MSLDGQIKTRHNLPERLLLFVSRKPGSADLRTDVEKLTLDTALSMLLRAFPDFSARVANKDVLDFGCGGGLQAAAIARNGARYVVGIDTNEKNLNQARNLARELRLENQMDFATRLEDRFKNRFDVVISQNSMEHFSDPLGILEQMKSALKPRGSILIAFAPPWFAPYGSHMHFFTKVPWVNILFSEKTVMNVRSHFRSDGATRYEDVESGLNKMTVARFEDLIATIGMDTEKVVYTCVKRLNFLAKIPIVRELFINEVSCILSNG